MADRVLPQMIREEGPSSLLRGVGPNVIRAVLMNSSQLASYVVYATGARMEIADGAS